MAYLQERIQIIYIYEWVGICARRAEEVQIVMQVTDVFLIWYEVLRIWFGGK